jgi:hypothetical protein
MPKVLPNVENIQVVPMDLVQWRPTSRIEVRKYTDKFTGEEVNAYLPILKEFGAPFTKMGINEYDFDINRIDFNPAKEVENNLERYLRMAFFNNIAFAESNTKLTLGLLCGDTVWYYNLNHEVQAGVVSRAGIWFNNIKARKIITCSAKFYEIIGKEANVD